LVSRQGSSINSVDDLKNTRLGIVGPLDKNWLILQAYAKHKFGIDLDQAVKKTIGTPPELIKALAAASWIQ
jgi:NitT/TauT family transport system substrate-binding protein